MTFPQFVLVSDSQSRSVLSTSFTAGMSIWRSNILCHTVWCQICKLYTRVLLYAVTHLVEALRYKPEGRSFDVIRCQWNF